MRWFWYVAALVLPGGLLILGLELLRRYVERRNGPHLVDELRDWQRRPPEMPAIHLPSVKPLKSRRASEDRVARFQRRIH